MADRNLLEEVDEKINRIENRISGMRTEFRGRLNEIQGEVEEMRIQSDAGQRRIIERIQHIGVICLGLGVLLLAGQVIWRLFDWYHAKQEDDAK